MNIGKSLRIAMEQKDVDKDELAKRINRSVSFVNQLRRADNATVDTIKMLSDAFGIKASEFIALGE